MKNMRIKSKLIILFVVIKVIPLLLISYIAVIGANSLSNYFLTSTQSLFDESKRIISNTASIAINDSIIALNKKSQTSMETLSYNVANSVATFLYERDKDILFLSKLDMNQDTLQNFYNTKYKEILVHGKYYYNEKDAIWVSAKSSKNLQRENTEAILKDNKKEFNYNDPIDIANKVLPIYKEVVFFDLNGNEKFKVSTINANKLDLSHKKNTYIKAENYFDEISKLKKDEIYVSDVIGAYVSSKIIGTFTKEKTKKRGIAFRPELYGYAGK
ncbi:MAG: sensor histidine kinase, partial [Campylobacteraceae bacterium]|nr:sensor histidine kinase [Campylobacteraceae bacterium]